MIRSKVTGQTKNNSAEVECVITGTLDDFTVEYEAIMRAIASNPMLIVAADKVTDKLVKEHNIDLPDCFRPTSDTIKDFINNIIKGE